MRVEESVINQTFNDYVKLITAWIRVHYTEEAANLILNSIALQKDTRTDDIRWRGSFQIFTHGYSFHINFAVTSDETKPEGYRTYLGAASRNRYFLPGEDWHRGSDLADGPLTLETMLKILRDVNSYDIETGLTPQTE